MFPQFFDLVISLTGSALTALMPLSELFISENISGDRTISSPILSTEQDLNLRQEIAWFRVHRVQMCKRRLRPFPGTRHTLPFPHSSLTNPFLERLGWGIKKIKEFKKEGYEDGDGALWR